MFWINSKNQWYRTLYSFILSKRRMAYPETLAQKFIFYPWPWKHLWHWNKSVLYLVTISQAIWCDNITKRSVSSYLLLARTCILYLGPCCISVFIFEYKKRLQITTARIHTAMVVAMVNVNCGFKHRVHEIFCG